jgi:hypothetical protein
MRLQPAFLKWFGRNGSQQFQFFIDSQVHVIPGGNTEKAVRDRKRGFRKGDFFVCAL